MNIEITKSGFYFFDKTDHIGRQLNNMIFLYCKKYYGQKEREEINNQIILYIYEYLNSNCKKIEELEKQDLIRIKAYISREIIYFINDDNFYSKVIWSNGKNRRFFIKENITIQERIDNEEVQYFNVIEYSDIFDYNELNILKDYLDTGSIEKKHKQSLLYKTKIKKIKTIRFYQIEKAARLLTNYLFLEYKSLNDFLKEDFMEHDILVNNIDLFNKTEDEVIEQFYDFINKAIHYDNKYRNNEIVKDYNVNKEINKVFKNNNLKVITLKNGIII